MEVEIKETRVEGVVNFSYGADGIMYAYIFEDIEDQVEALKLASKTIGEMTNGEKIPVLIEYADFVLPNNESQEYWSKESSSPYTSAEAYVLNSLALRLLLNFFMKFKKPPRPIIIFSNKEEAVIWLKNYLD